MVPTLRRASDNVFLDLGFEPEEAENIRLRSDLMMTIAAVIERRELTQAAAAKMFGVSQPRVSDLVRGKINLFSIDGLIAMLGKAGVTVTVSTSAWDSRVRAIDAPVVASRVTEAGGAQTAVVSRPAESGQVVGAGATGWVEFFRANVPEYCGQVA